MPSCKISQVKWKVVPSEFHTLPLLGGATSDVTFKYCVGWWTIWVRGYPWPRLDWKGFQWADVNQTGLQNGKINHSVVSIMKLSKKTRGCGLNRDIICNKDLNCQSHLYNKQADLQVPSV